MNKEQIKQHVKKYKTVYITGGVCFVVGVLGGATYAATRPESLVQQKNFLVWKPRQDVVQVKVTVEELSTPSKPLIDEATKTVYNSINDAVRKTGRTRSSILGDDTFKLLEELPQEIHAS